MTVRHAAVQDVSASYRGQEATAARIYRVGELAEAARLLLEGHFPLVQVEGEVSNLSRPASGHLYFTLKDERAQIRCALFRNRALRLRGLPRDGQQVVLRARVSLYTGRGDFQLIVEHLEAAGAGALRRQFEELKQRLAAAGLFDQANKRALPPFPQRVGVMTSPTGAVIRDILTVSRRRFPLVEVIVYPVPVQGERAVPEMLEMLRRIAHRGECEVLILARGGGSLEDLAAFNDESLGRALAAFPLPVVSAIGHESDFSICDFVADRRAATPSAAAELVWPDGRAWADRLRQYRLRFRQPLARSLEQRRRLLDGLRRRLDLRNPKTRAQQLQQRLDELQMRGVLLLRRRLRLCRDQHERLRQRLQPLLLRRRLQGYRERLTRLSGALLLAQRRNLQTKASQGQALLDRLQNVSPLATLQRGYALALDDRGDLVTQVARLRVGDALQVRLRDGRVDCRVLGIQPEE